MKNAPKISIATVKCRSFFGLKFTQPGVWGTKLTCFVCRAFTHHSIILCTPSPALCRVVNDIVDLVKMEHHQLELVIADFDLRTCIESALATVEAMPKSAKLHLGYLLPHDVTLKGDSKRVQHILLNLFSNAVQSTEKGLVTLRCQVMDTEDAIEVQFIVDISPQASHTLMQAFGKVTSSISQLQDCMSPGLLICQHLLNAMDSQLELSSVPGKGSKFSFTLSSQGTVHLPPPEAKGKSALIIASCPGESELLRGHCESLAMKVCEEKMTDSTVEQWGPSQALSVVFFLLLLLRILNPPSPFHASQLV